ncbi:hypothetical protein PCANC_28650 [Puccinia coronata f. sp. avenae]|uniref:Uncharacterized protein n=1 Tax=Puccinia coronata f. sp. avenae TaxID=200324 RepID=A0A2N5RVR6_9BASI|nr:hypothetical protein PCANC_28650 [Puccinia coronata f. sp. avenae]
MFWEPAAPKRLAQVWRTNLGIQKLSRLTSRSSGNGWPGPTSPCVQGPPSIDRFSSALSLYELRPLTLLHCNLLSALPSPSSSVSYALPPPAPTLECAPGQADVQPAESPSRLVARLPRGSAGFHPGLTAPPDKSCIGSSYRVPGSNLRADTVNLGEQDLSTAARCLTTRYAKFLPSACQSPQQAASMPAQTLTSWLPACQTPQQGGSLPAKSLSWLKAGDRPAKSQPAESLSMLVASLSRVSQQAGGQESLSRLVVESLSAG